MYQTKPKLPLRLMNCPVKWVSPFLRATLYFPIHAGVGSYLTGAWEIKQAWERAWVGVCAQTACTDLVVVFAECSGQTTCSICPGTLPKGRVSEQFPTSLSKGLLLAHRRCRTLPTQTQGRAGWGEGPDLKLMGVILPGCQLTSALVDGARFKERAWWTCI